MTRTVHNLIIIKMIKNIVWVFIGTIIGVCRGSGMLTHMDVTERAFKSFKSADKSYYPYAEVIYKHKSYVMAGSPFPDWGYLCGTESGELSHWPPFVEAYLKYLEENY